MSPQGYTFVDEMQPSGYTRDRGGAWLRVDPSNHRVKPEDPACAQSASKFDSILNRLEEAACNGGVLNVTEAHLPTRILDELCAAVASQRTCPGAHARLLARCRQG